MAATTERRERAESSQPAANDAAQADETRLFAWVAAATGHPIAAQTRLPTVRPAWRIDLQGSRDATTPFVLRCARPAGFGLSSVYSLAREARVLRSLARHSFPVPQIVAESPEPEALLLECMPGTSDFALLDADPAWKGIVVDHFIELLVRLHELPIADLDVPPTGADTMNPARDELRTWRGLYLGAIAEPDELLAFALDWLDRNAPDCHERVLVQGDTGPNQCLFDRRGVTAVLDWELAHIGDPMEDLGWIAARTHFASYGSLPAVLERYARLSGRELDFGRIGYYRVMALVKCAIATGLARASLGSADDVGSILCWDTITRHALAWSLVQNATDASSIARPITPDVALDPVTTAITAALRDVAATQASPYDSLRLRGFADSIAWLALRQSASRQPASRSAPEPHDRGDQALARQFLAREELDSALLAQAFGARGQIRLEALR